MKKMVISKSKKLVNRRKVNIKNNDDAFFHQIYWFLCTFDKTFL